MFIAMAWLLGLGWEGDGVEQCLRWHWNGVPGVLTVLGMAQLTAIRCGRPGGAWWHHDTPPWRWAREPGS